MYHQRNNWIGSSSLSHETPTATKRKYIPSEEEVRQQAKVSHEGGRFTCPHCRESFSTTYGIYGKPSFFSDATFYCKRCVHDFPKFVKG